MFNTDKLKTNFKELLVVKKEKTIFWFFPSFSLFCIFSLKIGFLCFLWQLRHAWRCWDILFHFWRVTFWCFFDFQSFDRICIAKLYVISILFFMFFLKAVMAQLTRIDSFLQTYFSIFCEKLRIHLENCFVIFFFATAPCMAQLKHLIHFWRVNFWCFFEY